LQQITPKNRLRHVAVVQLATGAVELATPGEAWAYNPLDMTSIATVAARRAAFSSDDQRLVTIDTKPACPSATQISRAMMPMMVPICPHLTSTLEVWSVTAGHRIAEVSFEFTPGPVRTESPSDASQPAAEGMPLPILLALLQTSSPGLVDDRTVIQTKLDSDPVRGTDPATLVTERIDLDVSLLTDRACARLPADDRVIRREDWLRDLPGEAYRPICK
jgi:hypothetical protein